MLAEHNELMKDPKEREKEKQDKQAQEALDYQMEHNDIVKDFMNRF